MKIPLLFVSIGVLVCVLTGACASSHPEMDRRLENSFRLDRKKKMDDRAFEDALKHGADPNMEMQNGATPLIMAILRDRPDLLKTLIKYGADIKRGGKRGSTPLHIAASQNRMKCVEFLLKAGADVNAPGAFGRTPLMEASRIGNLKIMEELIDAQANVNAKDKMDRTALMHAAFAYKNSLSACRMLVSAGADPMAFDQDLKIAAMHSAEHKHTEAALYLIDLIPDIPEKPALNLMIMYYAIKGNDLKVLERLIDRRPPLNRSLSLVLKGTKILQVHGFYRILIRNGLLGKGRVPLHWAAIENNLGAVKLLVARGADPFQPYELGNPADDLATSREVIQYLRKHQKTAAKLSRENRGGPRK